MSQHRTRSMVASAPTPSARLRATVFLHDRVSSHALPRPGEVVIGRADDVGIVIEHDTVSRRHAVLRLGHEIEIIDLGSANGTRIGGKRLAPNVPQPIALATIVELGATMLVVQLEGQAITRAGGVSSIREPQVGLSEAMQHLYRLIDNVADSNITVVLRGETGAGKEVVADEIHKRSDRSAGPMVKLNCAALPEHLLEGELFGYERGAFTGATAAKPGLIEAAHGGTVFLDEVGEMPLATQAKLLRVLESREVMRLGSLRPKPVDIRFVAATHRDLESMVESGSFRQDLYYRLNGVSIEVPPLRERIEDIPRLCSELATQFCRASKRPTVPISDAALAVLRAHTWPGNVRELRNVIERAIVFCKTTMIGPEHIGASVTRPSARPSAPAPAQVVIRSSAPPGPNTLGLGATAFAPPGANSLGLGSTALAPAPTPRGSSPPMTAPPGANSLGLGATALAPPGANSLGLGATLHAEVDALERERILKALEQCGGNQTLAAEMLGISRRTLLRRLDSYALPRPRKP